MKGWKTLATKIAFDSRWMKIRRDKVLLPNGKIVNDFFVWLAGDGVLIVPFISKHELLLVKLYKHAIDRFVIEFPAGSIDKGETPKKAALRELYEETGHYSKHLTKIGELYENADKVVGKIHVFLARKVHPPKKTLPQFKKTKGIKTIKLSSKKIMSMIDEGQIAHAATIAAFSMSLRTQSK